MERKISGKKKKFRAHAKPGSSQKNYNNFFPILFLIYTSKDSPPTGIVLLLLSLQKKD